ncbi:MAG: efflux RND transporter periplasmic adaptor subunit [Planctomycetes bacterium]|nr:efflux RND transporter periplasmic adaptor subunit [Planctomycetota bacterium]
MSNPQPEPEPDLPKRKGFVGHIWRFAIIASAMAVVVLVSQIPKRQVDVIGAKSPPVNVSVVQITLEAAVLDTFDLPAAVEPNRVTTVSAEIAGRIERIACKKGQRLEPGDVIVTLNTDLLMPQCDAAKAQYEGARLEWERMQELVEKKATAQKDLDDATTKLSIARATLGQIEATLSRCCITAPEGGVINELPVELGEYLDPGMPVAELVDTTTVKVAVGLPERDVPYFCVGQTAEIMALLRSVDQSFSGTITFMSQVADIQTRSTCMEIALPNPDQQLHSGQIVLVRLTRQTFKNAIFVPLLAVIPMESMKSVYVVDNGEAVRREVELGAIRGDRIQILKGLHAGDQLIIQGHRFVAPGLKVTVIPKKP